MIDRLEGIPDKTITLFEITFYRSGGRVWYVKGDPLTSQPALHPTPPLDRNQEKARGGQGTRVWML